MPKFDASTIGDVEYDFTVWKGCRGSHYEGRPIDDKGIVPEPSRDLVSRTMKAITAAFKENDINNVDENPDSVVKVMEKLEDDAMFMKLSDELLDAIAELCDGAPTRDSLESLGWRRFMAFFGYVMRELMSPEVEKPSTNESSVRLRSV